MNKKQKEILKIEEDFYYKLEKEIEKDKNESKKLLITNIKLVGKASWKDKIIRKTISENIFIVEQEITEIDKNGNERKTKQQKYYLGDNLIAGRIGYDDNIIYDPNFENFEVDKFIAVNSLLNNVSEKAIENYSLNTLRAKEISEILSAHLGREVSNEEVEEILEKREKNKNILNQKKQEEQEEISEKQSEDVKVKAIQRVDLNKVVDGKQKLAKRLDLEEYDYLYIISSENVNEINPEIKRNNTTYSLVGSTEEGKVKVLNNEFEMDKSVGNSASKETTKIRANNTATRDNKDLSIYTRKSNGTSIGCENNQGNVDVFFYQETLKDREKIGIEIETSRTRAIPLETRELMSENKGASQKDKIKSEIKEHTDNGCNPDNIKDFDGNGETSSHEHIDYRKVDKKGNIPNTNMSWEEFATRCGYRGENWIQKAVETVNKLPEINQNNLEKIIEEIEEQFEINLDKKI